MSYIVGIAGGSGSGKSTFATQLLQRLGASAVTISHDDYYKHLPGMTPQERIAYNFDIPAALDTHLLVQDIRALKAGKAVEIPIYDFTTQTRGEKTRHLEPAPVVVVEGILVMSDPELRQLMDLAIYVDAPADIRLARRLLRDCSERGHNLEGAIEMYLNNARPAHDQYVEPCKEAADLVVTNALNQATLETVANGILQAVGE